MFDGEKAEKCIIVQFWGEDFEIVRLLRFGAKTEADNLKVVPTFAKKQKRATQKAAPTLRRRKNPTRNQTEKLKRDIFVGDFWAGDAGTAVVSATLTEITFGCVGRAACKTSATACSGTITSRT
jgi:hypothetical protein